MFGGKSTIVWMAALAVAPLFMWSLPALADEDGEDCPCCYVPDAGDNPLLARYENPDDGDGTPGSELGYVSFEVTGDEAIREDFDRALGYLHHMMYIYARETFEDIAERDPDCAMAYWGIATSLFQPLWPGRPSEEDLQRGWDTINEARERVESDREEKLIEATAAFFREPETADFWTRIARWAEGMEDAYAAHPDCVDTAALYGLSRVTLAQVVQNRDPLLDDAENVLRDIFEQHPTHPGAIHYSIHATDVDGRAENALDMVEAYGQIAPDVPHALHMPSHIYVRLGNWPEVVAWNERSAKTALEYPAGDRISIHWIHALDYKLYAYLQQGEDEKARAVVDEAFSTEQRHQEDFVTAFHKAIMPARLAVEQRDGEAAAELQPNHPDYVEWERYEWPQAITWFAKGMGYVKTDRLEQAREAEAQIIALRDAAQAAGEVQFATYIEVDRLILSGWLAWAEGDTEEAVALVREAAELEPTVEKHPVTPGALLPPNEALGDLLMELDRPDEALEAYEASDAIWPERHNTLLGAARAAEAAGEEEIAREYYERLLANTGESERAVVGEARAFDGD